MAKKAKPVKLNDIDLIELTNLREIGDPDISRRAAVIIECAKGLTNKEVSEITGMNRMDVARWRESYLQNGIDGLNSKHSGGPGSSASNDDFNSKLEELLSNKKMAWTANDLAKALDSNEGRVHYALRKRGITLERQRQWSIQTQDEVIPKMVDIVGLYITKSEQALLVCCSSNPMYSSNGEFITRNKELSSDFSSFSGKSISLTEAINTSIERIHEIAQQKPLSLMDFLSETMEMMPADSDYEYHLYVLSSEERPYRGKKIKGVYLSKPDTSVQWLSIVQQKVSELGDRNQIYAANGLYKAIQSYIDNAEDASSPLVWRKKPSMINSIETGETGQGEAVEIEKKDSRDSFLSKLRDFLQENLASKGRRNDELKVGCISFALIGSDLVFDVNQSEDNVLCVPDLQFNTLQEYTDTLSKLEKEILKVRNISGKREIEMAAELLKKNRIITA